MAERRKYEVAKPKVKEDDWQKTFNVKLTKDEQIKQLDICIQELKAEIENLRQDLDKRFEDTSLYIEMKREIAASRKIRDYETSFYNKEIVLTEQNPTPRLSGIVTSNGGDVDLLINQNIMLRASLIAKDYTIKYLNAILAGVPLISRKERKKPVGHPIIIDDAKRQSIIYLRNHPVDPKKKFTPYAEIAKVEHVSVGIVHRICNPKN